jgi:hypothetical protein
MNILLTNHHLLSYGGTEIFTATLAEFLKQNGHKVYIYSHYVNNFLSKFSSLDITVSSDLKEFSSIPFDIIHVHHNINAIEIRDIFPHTPIIFESHGILPFLEQPPPININISHYIAISEEVRQNLNRYNIPDDMITTIGNLVDTSKFYPTTTVNPIPQRALLLSSRIGEKEEKNIREACRQQNIELIAKGSRFGFINQDDLPKEINKSDIVFSLGRGVIETMLCGRIPIVYDYLGGDGIVSSKNFDKLNFNNFSGRHYSKNYTVNDLIKEIKRYDHSQGEILKNLAIKKFDANHNCKKIIKLYSKIIEGSSSNNADEKDLRITRYISQAIKTTREYTYQLHKEKFDEKYNTKNKTAKIYKIYYESYKRYVDTTSNNIIQENTKLKSEIQNIKEKNRLHQENLNEIKSSKFFKIWRTYNNIKDVAKKL